jgi:hypothetical protein
MTFVLAVCLSNRQHWWHLCWRSFKWPVITNWSLLAGRPPASTKGHFYWLKVAGRCRARQQKPVLAARTNRFWPSAFSTRQFFYMYVFFHMMSASYYCYRFSSWAHEVWQPDMDLVGPLLVAMASLLDAPGLQFLLWVAVSISVNCFASACSSNSWSWLILQKTKTLSVYRTYFVSLIAGNFQVIGTQCIEVW